MRKLVRLFGFQGLRTQGSRKLYIESYGCQMNFSDSEIVASILKKDGFDTTSDILQADVIFLNTCSIREKAEQTVETGSPISTV